MASWSSWQQWRRAALLVLASCGPVAAMGGEAPPDVLLVTLDTTRSDRLGCYGDPLAVTPTIDALAARGVRYERALTASPLTLPAHASLMTGLDPPRHGLHDNGLAALGKGSRTLAEAFRAAGYATGAVIASGVLDHRFGLDRGFDHYDDALTAEQVGEYGYPERDAAAVTDAALEWASGLAGDPWFLWVHYYDPHAPYVVREGEGGGLSAEERYAGEIAWMDRQLSRLLSGLPGQTANRVILVVGDHGEMLGEHGERAHGLLLYRASLEVPLVAAGPGLPRGLVVEETIATKGVGATLARLARVDGEGFGEPLPGVVGAEAASPDPVYSETWLPATAYGWSRLLAVSSDSWRYVQAPRPELYDFVSDPNEEENLVGTRPERVVEMRRLLGAFALQEGEPVAEAPADAAEVQAQVRALGYLSGMTGGGEGVIDPKDGIGWLEEFEAAKRSMAAGDPWDSRRRLDALVRRNPGNVPFLMRAAGAHFATGSPQRGLQLLERALEINPRLDLLHLTMANAQLEVGDPAAAMKAFRAALDLNPRLAGAWLGLARLAAVSGDAEGERRELESAVEAGTVSGAIETRLGQLALARSELAAADEHLSAATGLVPDLAPAWWSWGEVAEREGAFESAVERYGRAIALNPGEAGARLHVGRLLLTLERSQEAERMLETVIRIAPRSEAAREARALMATGVGSTEPGLQ